MRLIEAADKYRKFIGTAVRIFTVSAVFLIFVYIYLMDPLAGPDYPHCFTQTMFGFRCIGCGATRAVHSLLHGDIKAALGFNFLAVFLFPAAVVFMLCYIFKGNDAEKFIKINTPAAAVLAIIVLVLTVLRNIYNI
jgi:hypothetical protein